MPRRHALCLAGAMSLMPVAAACAEALVWFGYAGIDCGLDDPHDNATITDYSDEAAGFTNVSHICLDFDPAVTAKRLRNAVAHGFTPLLQIEPAFFALTAQGLRPAPDAPALWALVTQAITESHVPASDILFYLADEPVLRKLPPADLAAAADTLRRTYPDARVMVIDAYDPGGPPPVPPQIDYWGFDAYAVPDPGAEPLYTDYLDRAGAGMTRDQHLVLVMDAMHTPVHAKARITEAGMADVARAYYDLAVRRGDVAAILAYSWAGGIDGPWEKGVRDLPPEVRAAHEEIGRAILAGP
jgi:hypothetical protein